MTILQALIIEQIGNVIIADMNGLPPYLSERGDINVQNVTSNCSKCSHEMKPLNNYFSEGTLTHLKPHQGLSERYQRRALDVTLACRLTHVYGKYHLAMLYRKLAMSEEQTTYQQAERTADMMNQITIFRSSPSDFLRTKQDGI